MKILVRQHVNNGDKSNKTFTNIDDALKQLGKGLNEVYLKVDWLNQVDLYFTGTKDYLRITN